MDSDESDFYGDDDLVRHLEAQVDAFDVDGWWDERKGSNMVPGRQSDKVAVHRSRLHNPLDHLKSCAWQLNESVDAFLERLPPSTTDITSEVPWIWISNPYLPGDPTTTPVSGDGHDGPDVKSHQIWTFTEKSMRILNEFRDLEEEDTKKGRNPVLGAAHLGKLRTKLASDILDLAYQYKVRSGKWMLFCDPASVDEVWETVAKATMRNELGTMAKVAPREEGADRRKQRLICVYTADFRDTKDVARVLQRLRQIGLVERGSGTIYYKPDAYTHVGIARDNPWKIQPTLYNSSSM